MSEKDIARFARRIRASVKRTGAPGLEEELRAFIADAVSHAELTTCLKVADTLGVSMDACLGLPIAKGHAVRVSPFVAWQLERVRDAMPFLGSDHHELADYIFKRFIWDQLGRLPPKDSGPESGRA